MGEVVMMGEAIHGQNGSGEGTDTLADVIGHLVGEVTQGRSGVWARKQIGEVASWRRV